MRVAPVLLCALGVFLRPLPCTAETFVEDFSTTTWADTLNTTASWNTAAGRLELPPFVPSSIGSLDTPNGAICVAVEGDRAYIADLSSFRVVDISDPTSPSSVTSIGTGGWTHRVTVSGNHAYVANAFSPAAVKVVDVSNPASPVEVASYPSSHQPNGVAISGDHAYVADDSGGLLVLDVTTPSSPTYVGVVPTPGNALGVAVAGRRAYVVDSTPALRVIDISNPASPSVVGGVPIGGTAWNVEVDGTHAFVAVGAVGLQVIDVSSPTSPAVIGTVDTPGSAGQVAVRGDLAYVADDTAGLQVVDVSDPTSPALLFAVDTPERASYVVPAGEIVYVADNAGGLHVARVCSVDPASPLLGQLDPGSLSYAGLAVAGDYAYMTDATGVYVIDISTPSSPAQVSQTPALGAPSGTFLDGNLLYTTGQDDGFLYTGFRVFDVTAGSSAAVIGSAHTPGNASEVVAAGRYAYVGVSTGLMVVDVSNPAAPALGSTLAMPAPKRMRVCGDHIYAACGSGLRVIDISAAASPVVVDSYDPGGTVDFAAIEVAGDLLFTVTNEYPARFMTFSVQDPTNLTLLGTVSDIVAYDLRAAGDLVSTGYYLIDVSEPTTPSLVGYGGGTPRRFFLAGEHAFHLDSNAGLRCRQAFTHSVETSENEGRSLPLPLAESRDVEEVRLVSTQTGSVGWQVSADGGTNWVSVSPTGIWHGLASSGQQLVWRASLGGSDATVDEVTLEWRYASDAFQDLNAGLPGVKAGAVAWGDYDADGDLDVLIAGRAGSGRISRVYRNDGGSFSDIGAGLVGVEYATVAWGDYDKDGDLDIALAGYDSYPGAAAPRAEPITTTSKVYRNDGGTFVDVGAGLPGTSSGSVEWGDFDRDGDLDILLVGLGDTEPITRVYIHDAGSFVDMAAGLPPLDAGEATWGDYDNDGDLDILLAGFQGISAITRVYRNDAGTFVDIAAAVPALGRGSVAWGDHDQDGDLDILMTGFGFLSPSTVVLRNDAGSFVDIGAGLPAAYDGSGRWGDYDNDGDLDVLLTGTGATPRLAVVCRNDGGSFAQAETLLGVALSAAEWGDCDNDGDLDALIAGDPFPAGAVTRIYSNLAVAANTPPAAPANLAAQVVGGQLTMQWDAATDGQTASPGLTYNLRVGTTPGGSELVSPMADGGTGYRRVARMGGVQHVTSWSLAALPPSGIIYWSVQAVDAAFAGSPFATEQSFDITGVGVDVAAGLPVQYALYPGSPNPFRAAATLRFDLPGAGHTRLVIYDVLGRRVRVLMNGKLEAGRYAPVWNGRDQSGFATAPGVYFVRLESGSFRAVRKVVRTR